MVGHVNQKGILLISRVSYSSLTMRRLILAQRNGRISLLVECMQIQPEILIISWLPHPLSLPAHFVVTIHPVILCLMCILSPLSSPNMRERSRCSVVRTQRKHKKVSESHGRSSSCAPLLVPTRPPNPIHGLRFCSTHKEIRPKCKW
ncbi:hypothetical protein QR685DRAFT_518355 [Neurospora intermedia]|uniref:Uncharacterized protein n=1 Tax=Neurospora intermedia TaxID=5142 RepID=A0ABR3DMV5_NEUIN